jgi:hypothetical protein
MRSWRPSDVASCAIAIAMGVAVMVATRADPRLSPDSITYLSLAEHLRHGGDFVDFTREPFAVFPPIYPLLLAPFGASLTWARVVGALSVIGCCLLLHLLLRGRVRPWVGVGAVLAFGANAGMLRTASFTWSEATFTAVSLLFLVSLRRASRTWRWAALSGALAGLGFLTRYAGIGLLVVAPVALLACWWRRPIPRWQRVVPAVAAGSSAAVVAGAWLVRNLVVTGELLGPRLAGGSNERWHVMLWRPFESIGTDLVDGGRYLDRTVGVIAMAVFAAGVVAMWRQRRLALDDAAATAGVDLAVALAGVLSVVVPLAGRATTANDITGRVMAPILPLVAYAAAVLVDTIVGRTRRPESGRIVRATGRSVVVAACVGLVWSSWGAIGVARDLPGTGSSGDRAYYSPMLYDVIDALPAETAVLTNNPWGVWWQNRREPTLFAFVAPRAGNSHSPISGDRLRELVCAGPVALAWFTTFMNSEAESPAELRPDLLDVAAVNRSRSVLGGELYEVTPAQADTCAVSG